MRILRGGNIFQGEYQFLANDIFINSKLVQDSIILKSNDLITPAVTSIENIGKLARIEKDYDNVTAGGFVFIIRPCYNSDVFAKYMLYALQSSYFNKQLKSITKKSGQAFYNLGKERLIQLIVPIPPLDEQSRIIKAIEQFSPLIKEYDALEQQATKLDSEIYDKLKKSILQYASQGKLVPQDKNDEPASELLKRIRTEKKAQLGKKYVESYIYKGDDNRYYEHIGSKEVDITEEIPFELPENWCWSRLGTIIDISSGKNVTSSEMSKKEQLYPVYGGNGITGYYDKYNVEENTIIIGRVGFYCGSIHITKGKSWITDNAIVVKYPNKYIILSYMGLLLKHANFGKLSSSTAQPLVTGKIIKPYLIPISPLAEQERIVNKINEIFARL